MRYAKTIDIWEFPRELIKHLQPGQWVRAGRADERAPLGRFCGVTDSGTIWVDWSGKPVNFKRKMQALHCAR